MLLAPLPNELNTRQLYTEASDLVSSASLRMLNASYRNVTKGEIEQYREAIVGQRDSVLYRFDALSFHVTVLASRLRHFEAAMSNDGSDRGTLRQAANTALFLLDDIVFNAASMFDYWAGLVACVFIGPRKRATKWNSLHNSVRGAVGAGATHSEQYLRESSTALRVKRLHGAWIDALFGYRSEVIHFSAEKPNAAFLRHISSGVEVAPELKIHVPQKLVRKLSFLGDVASQPELPVLQGAAHLYFACFQALADLSLSLSSDIDEHYGRFHPLEGQFTYRQKSRNRSA
jgi:hypothetical protein